MPTTTLIPCEQTRRQLERGYLDNLSGAVKDASSGSKITSVLVETLGGESDKKQLYELLVNAFSANNGTIPSNLVQIIKGANGNDYVAALVYMPREEAEIQMGGVIDAFIGTLKIGEKKAFNIGMYEFHKGYCRRNAGADAQKNILLRYVNDSGLELEIERNKEGFSAGSKTLHNNHNWDRLIEAYSN